MKQSKVLTIAVLGFGGRAEGVVNIAMEFPESFKIVAVADILLDRCKRAKEVCGNDIVVFDSADAFYKSEMKVDGIWVISTEKTHPDIAVPALERDIPLICEKPLATTVEGARRICDAWSAHPVPMVIPHSLRYLPHYRKAREIIDSGILGRVLHIHASEQISPYHTVGYYRRGPGMYRSNTTFLLAKSSHDIDIINWMMSGVKAKSVACFGGSDYFKHRDGIPKRCSEDCLELLTCPYSGDRNLSGEKSSAVMVDDDTIALGDNSLCAWNSGAEQIDHQTMIIQYEDGTTVDFTLKCFGDDARPLQITGSLGTLYVEWGKVCLVTYHPQKEEIIMTPSLGGSHGGGDASLLLDWADAVCNGTTPHSASVYESAEAVFVCVAADKAMLDHSIIELDSIRPLDK